MYWELWDTDHVFLLTIEHFLSVLTVKSCSSYIVSHKIKKHILEEEKSEFIAI